jgi:hypothetical protein
MPTTFCQFFYECTSCHELNAKREITAFSVPMAMCLVRQSKTPTKGLAGGGSCMGESAVVLSAFWDFWCHIVATVTELKSSWFVFSTIGKSAGRLEASYALLAGNILETAGGSC